MGQLRNSGQHEGYLLLDRVLPGFSNIRAVKLG